MTVVDDQAVEAMRSLASGVGDDEPILAGESGAAGAAALMALHARGAALGLGLNQQARVLLVNTEGATAPALYESLVGNSPAEVLGHQERWLKQHM
ncbi:MAG: diaminopropionate ammonia-lyase [Ramlibacter sp.]|jgi:threonine dehydratase|nr:diaminopropionate ammonia-lyase [Ramlibacter sp.]